MALEKDKPLCCLEEDNAPVRIENNIKYKNC